MTETNFRLEITKSEKSVFGGLDELQVHALYDMKNGILKDRSAVLKVHYKRGERLDLQQLSLDLDPCIPTSKSTVHFEDNVPSRVHTFDPYPYPTFSKDTDNPIDADYLRENQNYREMVKLIPDSEAIKPLLETLVK